MTKVCTTAKCGTDYYNFLHNKSTLKNKKGRKKELIQTILGS